jgi:leucyl/phenylalanyl-tRNA--protein transferase
MIPWLKQHTPFPPLDSALAEPNGLLAAGGDLSSERLLNAYRQGIFPWFNAWQPILWWSPDPRMVLFPGELKISRSLSRRLHKADYQIVTDSSFRVVVESCAEMPRDGQSGTWIMPEIVDSYCALHELGFAHSVETWIDGQLVGGLYGIAIGGMFYGESMFHRAADTSKIAFVHLVRQLLDLGYGMIDCQMHTRHLASLGAREISRREFSTRLDELINYSYPPGKWHDQ